MSSTSLVSVTAVTRRAGPDFANIPDDPGQTVFALLSPSDLAKAARVCKHWSKFLENNTTLWRAFAERLGFKLPVEPSASANFLGVVRSCFWRGVCEAEWRRQVQHQEGVYGLETPIPFGNAINSLQLGADGRIYTGSTFGKITVTGKHKMGFWGPESMFQGPDSTVTSLETGNDGKMYVGFDDGKIQIWKEENLDVWKCEATLEGHTNVIWTIRIGPDGKVYTASGDGIAKVWSKNAAGVWSCEATLRGHGGNILTLQLGPDGKVYTGSLDSTAKIWSKNPEGAWSCEKTLEGGVQGIFSLQVGPDGRVYIGCGDDTAKVWSKNAQGAWNCEATLGGHTGGIYILKLGAEGNLYIGTFNGSVKIWKEKSVGVWVCEAILEEEGDFEKRVKTLEVTADGNVYAGFNDGLLKAWSKNAQGNWNRGVVLHGHTERVNGLALGADGKIYTGAHDASQRIWNFSITDEEMLTQVSERIEDLAGRYSEVLGRTNLLDSLFEALHQIKPPTDQRFKNMKASVYGFMTFSNFQNSNTKNGIVITAQDRFAAIQHARSKLSPAKANEVDRAFQRKKALDLARFEALPARLRNPVYGALYKLKPPKDPEHQNMFNYGEVVFHNRDKFNTKNRIAITNQDRAAAIRLALATLPAWDARMIALEFARTLKSDVAFVMQKFQALPQEFRNKVYGKLYEIVAPKVSGERWGEFAFLEQEGHSSSNAEKCAAILEALK